MAKLRPYLHFEDGKCREAMEFYKECFGGELELNTLGDSPMGEQAPEETKNNIMHSMLTKGEIVIMASDMLMKEMELNKGNNVTLCINGGTLDELKEYFSKLSEGGKVGHELKEEFFGTYGDLVDKFGVYWMFQADKPKES